MSRLLAQSINVPGLVAGQRNFHHQQHKGHGKSTTSSSGLRMSGFSGLQTVNPLNHTNTMLMRPVLGFYSKVASFGRGRRASRCVAKAMSSENFTEEAFKVLMLAQEEARRLFHTNVGTGQILLGLMGQGTGIPSKVLRSIMEIKLKDARVEVERIIGRGNGYVAVQIPFTTRAKHLLKLSLEEARQLGHDYIGSEHLLLSLLHESNGVAARVLENLGADPDDIRTQVYKELFQN